LFKDLQIKPLFIWAGGKTKHLKHISPFLQKTEIYVEPFFGGGAVFCYMYNNDLANSFIINDIKQELCSLYEEIKRNVDSFINESTKYQIEYLKFDSKEKRKSFYNEKRKEYWDKQSSGLLYFLMKTCFNGIWQTCKSSNGKFGTPCGLLNHVKPFINEQQIRNWNKVLQKTQICCGDFENINIPNKSLIYCDPPYRTSFTSYGESFSDNDQKRCVDFCINHSKESKVILSNKTDGIFFESLIGDVGVIHEFNTTHTAGRRKQTIIKDITTFSALKVKEILVTFPK
jgi:DNA adenine methylase